MSYYRNTFIGILFALSLCAGLFVSSTLWRREKEQEWRDITRSNGMAARDREALEAEVRVRAEQIRPLRDFCKAWEPHLRPVAAKDVGNYLRNGLATLATRTGLTTDGATVPAEPRPYAVGGGSIRVQQVSLNVVSESLPAMLTWLGAVEHEFPYARVESLSLSSYASRSLQLSITLLHPVEDRPGTPAANFSGKAHR